MSDAENETAPAGDMIRTLKAELKATREEADKRAEEAASLRRDIAYRDQESGRAAAKLRDQLDRKNLEVEGLSQKLKWIEEQRRKESEKKAKTDAPALIPLEIDEIYMALEALWRRASKNTRQKVRRLVEEGGQ